MYKKDQIVITPHGKARIVLVDNSDEAVRVEHLEAKTSITDYRFCDIKTEESITFFRPRTRGELVDALSKGTKCEVVATSMEITNILLDGWLKFEGKYRTLLSPNKGWVIYESI